MEEIKTIIKLFEDIRKSNSEVFESCREEKITMDNEYGALYQAFWQADLKMGDAVDLLKYIEQYLIYKQMPAFEEIIRCGSDKLKKI